MSNSRNQFKSVLNAYKEAYAVKDKDLIAQNNYRTDYYKAYLWRLLLGSVKIEIPDWWNIDYFRHNLIGLGRIGVTMLDDIPVQFSYSVTEINKWKYPTVVRSDDDVNLGTRRVGIDCEIITMFDAYTVSPYGGDITSLIEIYAGKLALCDGAIDTNIMVSRTPWLAEVEDAKDAENMRYMFSQMMSGRPAIFYKKAVPRPDARRAETPFTRMPVKENYISDIVQDTKRQIINEYLTAIGINNANVDKKERLISTEVAANNEELTCAVALWQDNVNRCVEKVRALYPGVDIKITFGGGVANDSLQPNADVSNQDGAE